MMGQRGESPDFYHGFVAQTLGPGRGAPPGGLESGEPGALEVVG